MKFLVIEDDRSVRKLLHIVLHRAGFEVVEATTGKEAMGILDSQAVEGIVLDLGLPDGMGKELMERLNRSDSNSYSRLAWVAVSALSKEEAARRYGPLGSNFMPKPFDPWELVSMLQKLVPR